MFVFFRHGKTLWNIEKRLQGQENNSELLPVSEELIKSINVEFKNIIFNCLFVSPLKRAVDYSNIIKLKYDKKLIEPALTEIAFGVLSGCRLDESDSKIINARNKNKWNYRPEGGESYSDLYNRLENFTRYLLSIQNEDIAVIGHETCNKVLIGKLLKLKQDEILNLKQSNDCVYKIENKILYKKFFTGENEWERL